MKRQTTWYLAPGFTYARAMQELQDYGLGAPTSCDEISTKKRKGWRKCTVSFEIVHAPADKPLCETRKTTPQYLPSARRVGVDDFT